MIGLFPLLSAALVYAGGTPAERLDCRVTPRAIEVGSFYNGAMVKVEGAVETGSKVVVAVVGSDAEASFNRKGRLGPIWLNSGKVRISGVPSLFLRFASEPVGAILSRECIAGRGLDKESLMRRMRTEPPPASGRGDAQIRADYLALKEGDGSYAFGDGGIQMTGAGGQNVAFALQFQWPKKAPPARYEVRAYEIRDGAVMREAFLPIEVVRAGFPAWLAGIAENRASLYGITAVLAGALAGFGIDFLTTRLFGKKRRTAH